MNRVYFDIDTQIDFLFPSGALYVPGAEKLLPVIAALNRSAAGAGARLISSMCAHRENDPEFRVWPPHCVTGTIGQQKPASTLTGQRLVIPAAGSFGGGFGGQTQLLVEKVELNLFSNPFVELALKSEEPLDCFVYGVVTEICVKFAAVGLLDRGHGVSLVTDAIRELDPAARDALFEEVTSRGGRLIPSGELLAA